MMEHADEELWQEVKRLKEDLMQTRKELKEAQRDEKPKRSGESPWRKSSAMDAVRRGTTERVVFTVRSSQGNGSRHLDQQ